MQIDLNKLNFSARLLAKEAAARGYTLELLPQTSSDSHSSIVRCTRESNKIYFRGTATTLDSPLARLMVSDKITTNKILSNAGLPTPKTIVLPRSQILATDSEDLSAIAPKAIAAAIKNLLQDGTLLVVKPSNTDHGDGITVGIANEPAVARAIIYAYDNSKDADILIQKMVDGQEFRFLVIDGQTVFVANRTPPAVIGNGKQTLRELIETINADPRRGEKYISSLTKIPLKDVAYFLGSEKLDQIPAAHERIELLKTSNLSRGGSSINVTETASEFLKDMAAQAAMACELGVAGVDIVTKDITGNSGRIIEVNVSPGLRVTVGEINAAKLIFNAIENKA